MRNECGESEVSATYRVSDYVIKLAILRERRYCLTRHSNTIILGISLEDLRRDIEESILGEAVAPLILLKPISIEGNKDLLNGLFCRYYSRLLLEEKKHLEKLFHRNIERLLVALMYPIAARISRLQQMYTWLRLLFTDYLREHDYYVWVNKVVKNCLGLRGTSNNYRLMELMEIVSLEISTPKAIPSRIAAMTRAAAEIASPSLLQAIPTSLLIESLSYKPHPLLRDPLLLTRLDAARIATKLLSFTDQLYSITGLSRLIGIAKPSAKRTSIMRSAATIEIGGFKPAVVKRYRDITAFKWIVAAILSLPLPKPILGTRARLNNEYYYNRLLNELGYPVPKPLLIDPRRRIAAYTYIEGKDLSVLIQDKQYDKLYYDLGELLASLHTKEISLWDTNPSNFIYSNGELYLVDLEQARRAKTIAEKAFDIAVAIYYSLIYSTKNVSKRAELLARGYLDSGGEPSVVIEAARHKYMAPFLTTIPPNMLEKARKALISTAMRSRNSGGEAG